MSSRPIPVEVYPTYSVRNSGSLLEQVAVTYRSISTSHEVKFRTTDGKGMANFGSLADKDFEIAACRPGHPLKVETMERIDRWIPGRNQNAQAQAQLNSSELHIRGPEPSKAHRHYSGKIPLTLP
jgi:hypothetical protein